ncbi:MAG: hypothetical protein KDC34_14370 [Saprospiraceae bacterium]|nr:hypothetical protein [Saprospiraceae bacterium]
MDYIKPFRIINLVGKPLLCLKHYNVTFLVYGDSSSYHPKLANNTFTILLSISAVRVSFASIVQPV